jgi:hypothetical protein
MNERHGDVRPADQLSTNPSNAVCRGVRESSNQLLDLEALDEIGLNIGAAADEIIDDVREISGMMDVSREGRFDVGQPDASIR